MAFIGNSPTQGVITGGNIVDGSIESIDLATLTNIDINSGSIDGTVIGGSTAAAGSFTTLETTGEATFSGNVGIGVTPSASSATTNIELPYGATLSSRSNTAAPQFAMMSNAVGNWYEPTYKINGYATQYTQQGFDGTHVWSTAASGTAGAAISFSQAMTLDASGNLGVNCTPSYPFHLTGSGDTVAAVTAGASSISALNLGNSTNLADGGIRYDNSANALILRASNAERMRIDSSGNVGIATSDPKSSLEVKGTFGAPATSGSAAGFISRFSQSSGVGSLDFGFGDPYSWIQSRASNNYGINFDLALQPNGGNVGIGTISPSAKVNIDTAVAGDSGASSATRNLLLLQTSGTQATAGTLKVDGIIHPSVHRINIDSSTGAGAAAPLSFSTANGATETMRIAADGNLGVGVTPNVSYSKLQVKAAATSYVADFIGNASGDSQLTFWNSNQTAAVSYIENQTAGAHMSIVAGSGRSLKLGAGGTAGQVLLDASGNLLVGTTNVNGAATTDGFVLYEQGTLHLTRVNDYVLYLNRRGTDGSLCQMVNDGAVVGSISVSGSSTAYNTSSDYRLKEDDVPMTGATERIKALRPINFAWKADGSRTDGFFAHEAQEVVPEAVHGTKDAMRDEEYEVTPAVEEVRDEDGNITTEAVAAVMGTRSVPDYQGIDQSKLVPLLTATIQELIARIEALENK